MKYYKVLKNDGSCCNGGSGKWYLPKKLKDGTWKPGKWMPEIVGILEPCENGYHICRPRDLVKWLDEAIFEVEYDGMIVKDNKCVVRKARLLSKCEGWNDKTARLFAADCAEHVLHICEDKHPNDDQSRKVTQAARDYINGIIGELPSAGANAGVAACGVAAVAAARAEARAEAGAAERKWQTKKLMGYLDETNK